jgi:hypothetical protein
MMGIDMIDIDMDKYLTLGEYLEPKKEDILYSKQENNFSYKKSIIPLPLLLNPSCALTANSKVKEKTNKQTPWSESASELFRPSDHRLSAK